MTSAYTPAYDGTAWLVPGPIRQVELSAVLVRGPMGRRTENAKDDGETAAVYSSPRGGWRAFRLADPHLRQSVQSGSTGSVTSPAGHGDANSDAFTCPAAAIVNNWGQRRYHSRARCRSSKRPRSPRWRESLLPQALVVLIAPRPQSAQDVRQVVTPRCDH